MADRFRGSPRRTTKGAPAPGWRERATLVDGNILSGAIDDVFAGDPSALMTECGMCGAIEVLAETVVEVDDDAFIVRCRSCTHTLMTVQRMPAGVVLRIDHLASLRGRGVTPAPGTPR